MKYTAVFVAIAGFVAAQDVNPASATASLLAALPTSIQQLALTNLPAASSVISAEIANPTGPPAWFTNLPPAVQTYFITANGGAAPSATAGISSALSSVSSAVSSLNSALSSATRPASSSVSARASSGTSTGAAALPTAAIGSGLAGAMGIAAMLAL